MIEKYIKKPIPVEAVQWTGTNQNEIKQFCKDAIFNVYDVAGPILADLYIHTLEGTMHANVGDYIIKGIKGEFYPCEKTIFEEVYTKV